MDFSRHLRFKMLHEARPYFTDEEGGKEAKEGAERHPRNHIYPNTPRTLPDTAVFLF